MGDGLFHLREIDMVRAKGKEAPVRIYELLARVDTPLSADRQEADAIYATGLAAYRQQAWREAMKQFNKACSSVRTTAPPRPWRRAAGSTWIHRRM